MDGRTNTASQKAPKRASERYLLFYRVVNQLHSHFVFRQLNTYLATKSIKTAFKQKTDDDENDDAEDAQKCAHFHLKMIRDKPRAHRTKETTLCNIL